MSAVTKTVLITLLGLLVFCVLCVTPKVLYFVILLLIACYFVGFGSVKVFKFLVKG